MSGGHTPGPWAWETPMGENCPWVVPAGQEAYEWVPIATLGDCLEDGPNPRSKAFKEIQANARLIAAAPELLEALLTFEKQWNACGPNSDFGRYFQSVRDAAVDALAKASPDHWTNTSRSAIARARGAA